MTTPMRMEEDPSHMTERILNLTLEIIYLLTGESYPVVKSGDQVTIRVPPPHSLKTERNREKKILEVTQKITELLTGEVPIRCQDVTVYFSMEEWEYLEGHKELYKDVMMASQPALTSPDGSSNGKPPERCPHPLYSHRDPTQTGSLSEVRVVVKEEVKEEDEKYGVMGELSKGHKDLHKDTMMEPSNSTIQPERCPHLLYAKQEGHKYPPFDQGKAVMDIKVEGEVEETNVRDDQQYTEEEEAGMTMTFIVGEEDMTGEKTSSAMDGGNHSVDKVWTPSDSEHPPTVEEEAGTQGKKKFCCSTCGRCFTTKSSHVLHQKSHAADRPYYCSECGKCFLHKSKLISHYRSHTGEKLYSCDQCGKCYSDQYSLSRHKKSHTDIKPYSCPKCKKLFHYKHSLVVHLRCHTGEKPYTCAECGKCFRRNSNLSRHKKLHTGEMPYFCSECGKSFRYKHSLLLHQRAHTGEKPYSCADCGKTFSDKSHVVRHEKTHMANQDPDDDDVIVL